MMRWITGSSVRLARLVAALAVAVVALGVSQLRSAPVDTYPEFLPPMVQVRTEALGLSAAEVEQLVTVPLEQDLLNGLPWLDEIRSESLTGLSSVDLVFEPGTDVLQARQMVQERLSQAAALPNVGGRPGMVQPLSSTSRVLMIGLSSKQLSLIDMSVLARWKIRPRLMGIPGVANVSVWGQRDRQLQVQVNPDRLAARGITLDRVVDSTGNALWSSPLTFVEASTPGTGGFIDTANQRLGVQHMMPITTSRQLAAVTIQDASGRRLRLSNVADVVEDHQPLIGDAMSAQGPSLMLVVQKFPEADTARVTRDVERAMQVLAPGLSGIRVDTTVFRPASFIESSMHNIGLAGGVSLLLVLLLLMVLAASWRVALIAFVALPVSLVVAAYVLYLRGTTFSSITLVGLVAALGVVIDDAVVDSDHIRRRLATRPGADQGPAATEDVVEASQEVRRPLLYATLVLLVLVAPLAVLGGVAGAFSRELAVSFALAVLASMAVALILTPALSFLLLRNAPVAPRERPVLRLARRVFDRGALHRVRRPRWAYATVAVFAVAGLAVVPLLGSRAMLPAPQDRDLLVELHAVPGTSLTEMARITNRIGREIDSVPGVRDVGLHVGRAVTSDQVVDVDSAEVWLSVSRSADYSATVDGVRHVVDQYRGLRHVVTTYEQQQLGAAQHGSDRPLVVRVYGQDLPTLRAQAEKVRRSISSVDGVQDPRVEAQPDQPTLQVEVDLARAERQGIRPGDVRRTAATLISGLLAGNLYQEQKVFDVVVWGTPTVRQNLSSVENLLIDAPGGRQVRLRDVATVRMGPSPAVIRHEDVSRFIDVTADVSGRRLGAVSADVQSKLRSMSYPLEYHAEVLDGHVVEGAGGGGVDGWVLGLGVAALLAAFLLMQALTRSWRTATLLLVLVPWGVVGGVLVAPFVGGLRSLGALLGLAAVLAVCVRHSLLLVHHIRTRHWDASSQDGSPVLAATRDRLAPVLLTTLALAAAMLPFAVVGGVAGAEILHPMAVVVLGGLVTATLLNLFVIPALYARFVGDAQPGPLTVPSQRDARTGETEEAHHAGS